jgi:poly(3-hydroxybutyrate) depolymerase
MKKVVIAKCIVLLVFFVSSIVASAQQTFRTTTSGSIIGYMEYLPSDYHSNSNKYPVVIFLHGVDERGANSTDPAVLQTTISLVTKLGPPQHVKNGAQFPFILISPQLKVSYGSWPASYVNEVIEHLKTYLRIDERRIHVTGLSMGGHGAWTCIQDLPSVFASGAPVCGANNSPSKACGIANENVAVWGFHGDADPVVSYTKTVNMVNAINKCVPAPSPLAKASIYGGVQHNAWYRAYYLDNKYHTPNVYQWWMEQLKTKKGTNVIPIANAGADKSVTSASTTITGSGSDSDGSISGYKWTQIQGPSPATLSNTSSSTLSVSGLKTGKYIFRLLVTDNGGLSDADYVAVNVTATGNASPVANAGSDKVINTPTSSTTFTGSATDSDGTVTAYAWTKVSGGTATLSGTSTPTLSVSGVTAGSYTFRLTVTDNGGATHFDDVILTVNTPPVVSAGADRSITLPANSVSITGTASDANGTISSYSWTKVSGGLATLGGTSTATLSASGLVQGSYVFRLTVRDNHGATTSDDVQVTVLQGSNNAPVADAGDDRIVNLPSNSVTITGTGSDTDGTISSYSWTKISGGAATLAGNTTPTLTASGLVAGTYVFRVAVTDNAGATDTDDVTVTVNNPPAVSAGADFSITLPLNTVSVQGTVSDADGTITSYSWKMTTGTVGTLSGTSTSKLTATGLVEGPYVFRLTVTDNLGATKFDDVKITVLPDPNPNVAPIADAGADQMITLPTNSLSITGSGADQDGTISSYSWTKVSGGAATLSGASSPALTVSDLVAGNYVFRLTIADNRGGTDYDDVTVIVNSPPTVSVGADFTVTLPTNSLAVQGVASDLDGTITTYQWRMTTGTIATLSGTSTSRLTATGLVEGSYVFRLIVTDDRGATKFDDVKVVVKTATQDDVTPNELPAASAGEDRLISLPTNSITITGTGTDEDGSIAGYNWTKISGGSATLTGATTPTLSAAGLVAGTYVFRLTVTDNRGGTGSDDVAITVNAPPSVSVGADFKITLPTNSLSVQGVVSDPDGTIISYQWKMTTGTIATLSGTNSPKLTATGLVEGPYVFRLFATDNHGATKFDDVKITVLPDPNPNVLPTADAGADQLISLPTNSITITGSGVDADGTISTYSWTKISGGTATLSGAGSQTLTASGLQAGTYVFRLAVTDNRGGTDTDDVSVLVNAPPVVSVGADYSITLPLNSVTVNGTASDPDGTIVSYQWRMTTGTIATLTGVNTRTLTATGLVEGPYVFRLIAKDNHGATKFDDIKITVRAATTAASELAQGIFSDEETDDQIDLASGPREFWQHKYVTVHDASGKEMYAGAWTSDRFKEVFTPGKLFTYTIKTEENRIKRGKIVVIR